MKEKTNKQNMQNVQANSEKLMTHKKSRDVVGQAAGEPKWLRGKKKHKNMIVISCINVARFLACKYNYELCMLQEKYVLYIYLINIQTT